jgi:beta-galactosidase
MSCEGYKSVDRRSFNKLIGLASISSLFGSIEESEAYAAPSQESRYALDRHYLLGTAYYPEWWEPEEWEIDFREMQELGINTVRMGEFAWSTYEPSPGRFNFEWMDGAIDVAVRHGIDVILGTPTASVPPWLYELHPDVLSGNNNGLYTYGGRKGYCPSSPDYLEACTRIVTALAGHYGHNSGVIGWQLDNEPGFPFQSYDPLTERAFQNWLKQRYGSLKNLTREWNGAFWSNEYSNWTQIRIPRNSAEGGWQPAISLAYREFFSDSFLNHLKRQADILHPNIRNQFIFTNWPSPAWSVDVFAAAAEFLDATAWDNYVSAPGLSKFQRQYTAGFFHDFCRCAGPKQRFLCAEQNAYVPPNASSEGLRLQAYMDLAHGTRGHFYFEWRRPLAGGEEHRPSFIKGFDGKINPAKTTLQCIGKEFAELGPRLTRATTTADIAILYDFTNEWAQGMGGIGDRNPRYTGEAMAYYNGLKILQRDIDVTCISADYFRYRLLIASNLHLIDDATIDRLRAFVKMGGILVLNYRAATQYKDNSMRRNLAPGPLEEIAGVKADAMLDLDEYNSQNGSFDQKKEAALGIAFHGETTVFHPRTIVESLRSLGAETIATVHGGDQMDGQPAVTLNRFGQGWVFYVGVDSMEDQFYESLARRIGKVGGIKSLIAAPYGVEVTSRKDDKATYYFLLNVTGNDYKSIALPYPMTDIVSGHSRLTHVSLKPFGVAVLSS